MNTKNITHITLFKRLLIIVYESVLLFAIYMLAGFPATVLFNVGVDHSIPIYTQPKYLLFWVYILSVMFLYFGYCWTRSGQTLAMKAWRCKVSNADGSLISWKQALIRYLSSIPSWLFFGAGFLLSAFRKDKAALHDLLSNSHLHKIE